MSEEFTVLARKAGLEINAGEAAKLANHLERIHQLVLSLQKVNLPVEVKLKPLIIAVSDLASDETVCQGQTVDIEKKRFTIPPLLETRE